MEPFEKFTSVCNANERRIMANFAARLQGLNYHAVRFGEIEATFERERKEL